MQPVFFLKMKNTSTINNRDNMLVSGLRGSSPAWFATTITKGSSLCCVVPDEQMVLDFEQDLQLFSSLPVIAYPGYEIPAYTPLSPDQRTTATRLSALYRIAENQEPFILVISIEALLRRVMPKTQLLQHAELLMEGEDTDIHQLCQILLQQGYDQTSLVKNVGDFSVRGGIVDVYPPGFLLPGSQLHEGPIRLDFFGDTIESIRSFDPLSQRSTSTLSEAVLLPVSDVFLPADDRAHLRQIKNSFLLRGEQLNWASEKTAELTERIQNGLRFAGIEFFLPLLLASKEAVTASVLDYLAEDTQIILLNSQAIHHQLQLVCERIETNFAATRHKHAPALPPEELFLSEKSLTESFQRFKRFEITDFVAEQDNNLVFQSTNHQLLKQEITLLRKKEGLLAPLVSRLAAWLDNGETVIICCRSERRQTMLAELLDRFSLPLVILQSPLNLDSLQSTSVHNPLYLSDLPLRSGFSLPAKRLHILSESELFGEMRLGSRKKTKRPVGPPINFTELLDGDIVVHREHGLGAFRGLVTIELQGITNDFMLLEYRDNDKLYVPVDRLNLVSRYEGLSDKQPKIDKLGTQSWKAVKQKVSDEVWKIAHELLDIYATREMRTGNAFSPPNELYRELEESFPYDETPGQFKAITETIDDLLSNRPMDRLICGDVGYGKTEVAIRAAFKVLEDGFQVAVLVPTTVLAEQHAKTFRDRLQGFPVQIECINRFRTPAQQKNIIADLKTGAIDILIGTHRLLSKDISFKRLGLLVVDEEHRFGVTHKEKIKRLKAEVDILTLTATPIPRTLQMSLLGIRDLSVISSPPEHRRPVKTFVARYDDLVIKEAVSRELIRGGQVFVVHNRVKSIQRMATSIHNLVPSARIAVAHGQMAGKELEEIMVSFVNHDIDVLVSTTIIESGLDIPSANTIIINRADTLGLAEIYQLRGRVGRSSTQSFAYLLVPSLDQLSKDSRERLRALMEYNELGGGFKLAMSDLQIRGGGNLLGVSQSGHIAAIGYDLYLDLLQKTVADLKARSDNGETIRSTDDFDPEITLRVSAYIPESYISDIGQRYVMYRRIAALTASDDISFQDLKDELHDRYGVLPEEISNLFTIVAIKKQFLPLRINKLEQGINSLVFSFLPDTPIQPERLASYLQSTKSGSRLTPEGRLIIRTETSTMQQICLTIEETIQNLKHLIHERTTD